MKNIILAVTLTAVAVACKKNAVNDAKGNIIPTSDTSTPACISSMITTLQQQAPFSPRAVIKEYNYRGQRVFYVSSDCCDQYNHVYDANCNILCAPDGGLIGNGDGRCTDFYQSASFVRDIWRDVR